MMWKCAGIERSAAGLAAGLAEAESWPLAGAEPRTREPFEQRQMATLSRLILCAAERRTESRGAHFRSDYPQSNDALWRRRQVFRCAD